MKSSEVVRDIQKIHAAIGPLTLDQLERILRRNRSALASGVKALKARMLDIGTLRKVSRLMPYLGDHELYESSLRNVDPALDLPGLEQPHFIGKGVGIGSMDCYRRARFEGRQVFEKVYLIDSDAFRKMMWFHDTVLPEFADRIRTPALSHVVRGKRLAAAYFELLPDTKPVAKEQLLTQALHLRDVFDGYTPAGLGPVIADFRRETLYADGVQHLHDVMTGAGLGVSLRSWAECRLMLPDVPRLFTHGDMAHSNVLQSGHLLDLDRCGFYPAGYEFGYTLSKSRRFDSIAAFDDLAETVILRGCPFTRLALYYFSAVFYARKAAVETPKDFVPALVARLAKLKAAGDMPFRQGSLQQV